MEEVNLDIEHKRKVKLLAATSYALSLSLKVWHQALNNSIPLTKLSPANYYFSKPVKLKTD